MRIVEEYELYLKDVRKYSPNTVSSYKRDVLFFLDFLKRRNFLLKSVNLEIAKKYLTTLDGEKESTIARKVASLRSFFNFLKSETPDLINPFSIITLPKKEENLPVFLYPNELEELLNAPENSTLGIRDLLILELLYSTGIRVSELVNIKLNDIDVEGQEIKIKGKGKKDRIVFFGDYAKDALINYLNTSYKELNIENTPYLILNNRGKPITRRGISYILDRLIEKTSITKKVSPHKIRHTFATHLLNEGCDIASVQELLGHESISTTAIYTHITDDRLKKVYLKSHPRSDKDLFSKDFDKS